jgi:hypothetical protein
VRKENKFQIPWKQIGQNKRARRVKKGGAVT